MLSVVEKRRNAAISKLLKERIMPSKYINLGDTVKLSGQTMLMTVEAIKDNRVFCAWFDRADNVNRYWFDRDELEVECPADGR
jgi:uncharacterized protein YodC (DUF2158 family)